MVTKGPWYQVPTDFAVIVDRDPNLEDARVVARCWDNRWQTRSVYDEDYEEGHANARAIAAVPGMVEICRKLDAYAQVELESGGPVHYPGLVEQARTILRAVEGKP